MNFRHALITAAAALSVGLASPVGAQETGDAEVPTVDGPPEQKPAEVPQRSVQQRLEFLLSGYEYFPTREDLDELGDAETIAGLLRAMAGDEDARNTKRLRAVDALGYYDDAESIALLKSLIEPLPEKLPRRQIRIGTLLRHHAITAYARSQKGEAIELLEPLLVDDEIQIRLTAISALGKHGGKQGLQVLKAAHDAEENPTVRRAMAKWVR